MNARFLLLCTTLVSCQESVARTSRTADPPTVSPVGARKKPPPFQGSDIYFSPRMGTILYVDALYTPTPGIWGYELHVLKPNGDTTATLSSYDCDREPRGCDALLRFAENLRDAGAYQSVPRIPWPLEDGKAAPQVRVGDVAFSWRGSAMGSVSMSRGPSTEQVHGTSDRTSLPRSIHVLPEQGIAVVTLTRERGSTFRAVFHDEPSDTSRAAVWMAASEEPTSVMDERAVYFSERTRAYLFVDSIVQPETGRACTLIVRGDRAEDLSARPASVARCAVGSVGFEGMRTIGARIVQDEQAAIVPEVAWPVAGTTPLPTFRIDGFEFQWSGHDFHIVRLTTGRSSPPLIRDSTDSVPVSVYITREPETSSAVIKLRASHDRISHIVVELP